MSLSPRLDSIAALVPLGANFADVGSDHGALPIFLVKSKRVRKALAIENKPGPYARLTKEVEKAGLKGSIELSLSDGISYLPSFIDSIVMSGMGGGLISKILNSGKNSLSSVSSIIVEPQGEKEEALSSLYELGYHCAKEICLYEMGHYYESYLFLKGKTKVPSMNELRFGVLGKLIGEESYKKHLEEESERLRSIIEENSLPKEVKDRYYADLIEMEKILNEH